MWEWFESTKDIVVKGLIYINEVVTSVLSGVAEGVLYTAGAATSTGILSKQCTVIPAQQSYRLELIEFATARRPQIIRRSVRRLTKDSPGRES
jgi:hypothetical protein